MPGSLSVSMEAEEDAKAKMRDDDRWVKEYILKYIPVQ